MFQAVRCPFTYFAVPYIVTPVCLLLVHFHPQPVDDCPCFEDAIAFVSVILGGFVARWHTAYAGIDRQLLQAVMPGGQGDVWTLAEKLRWFSFAGAKVIMGSSQMSVRDIYSYANTLQASSSSSPGAFSPKLFCILSFLRFSELWPSASTFLTDGSTLLQHTTPMCQLRTAYIPFLV